jgi:hypothetical protein
MALKIIKLVTSIQASTATVPKISRFFYEMPYTFKGLATFNIDATNFVNDKGETITELPILNEKNSYFNVYINGMLQMEDNFAYTAGEEGIGNLFISVPEGSHITVQTPIILEVINFYPTTDMKIHT